MLELVLPILSAVSAFIAIGQLIYDLAIKKYSYSFIFKVSKNGVQVKITIKRTTKPDSNGSLVAKWGSYGSGNGQFRNKSLAFFSYS